MRHELLPCPAVEERNGDQILFPARLGLGRTAQSPGDAADTDTVYLDTAAIQQECTNTPDTATKV
eukprot:6331337-Prymnesium_polylepis.1